VTVSHYDVLVVGAGPAGCAVAARMSEDPSLKVALLEQGPDWRLADAPEAMSAHGWTAYAGIEALSPFHNGGLRARHQADGPLLPYFGGRGIGGSSIINAQITLRPPLDCFDEWSRLGASRWSADMAAELWRRVEDDRDYGDRPEHGDNGRLSIERPPIEEWSWIDRTFWAAALDAGYEELEDINASVADGVGALPHGRRGGRRVTANHAYIETARSRANLHVHGDAQVDRVLLRPDATAATGVRARIAGRWQEISADHVVLSAGTIGSAGILLRTGIGPASDLHAAGVPVRHELPVGRALQDHYMLPISIEAELPDADRGRDLNLCSCALRYSSHLEGAPPGDVLLLPQSPITILGHYFPPAVAVWMFETYSRGSLRLLTSDPDDCPEVNLGLFSDERDLIRMRDGVHRASHLLDAAPFAIYGDRPRTIGATGVPLPAVEDDDALDAVIRRYAGPHAHVSCSAPMGRVGDTLTVVDADARVVGVDNLRVADLSICPSVVRAGPYPTAMMIGEFVADRMRDELSGDGPSQARSTGTPIRFLDGAEPPHANGQPIARQLQ